MQILFLFKMNHFLCKNPLFNVRNTIYGKGGLASLVHNTINLQLKKLAYACDG